MISPESLLSKRESLKETTFRGQREGRGPTAFRGEVRGFEGHSRVATMETPLVRNPNLATGAQSYHC